MNDYTHQPEGRAVPELLVYGDLINTNDRRCNETVQKFTMNTYKINYEQLRQNPEITDMLSALERGFEKFEIDFYLVGAVARDVWKFTFW